jgi:acetyl-CoA C-acetyltransferase
MAVCIVGWAHSPFGKLDAATLEGLIAEVTRGALADAGVDAADIDALTLGHFNSGFSDQDFAAPLILNADPAFRFKPATRVENACATGSAAVMAAADAIRAGKARLALAVGVEKMTHLPSDQIGRILLHACYRAEEQDIAGGFAGVFARIADMYAAKYGDQSEAMALIAAKNHANGVRNPFAQMRRDLGFEFCNTVSERNPLVAGRLRRTDCSPVSDGAAAVVLADLATAQGLRRAALLRAQVHVTDFMPMSRRDLTFLDGAAQAWRRALTAAKCGLDDLDFVETHDCFTIAELMHYEAMGLTPPGEGARAIREGWVARDGKLPVNVSGGLKAKGHPIGATGVSMHALCARQLFGEAGEGQVPGAALCGAFNMGGTGVANYVTILERVA